MRVLYVLGDVPAAGTGGYTRAASTLRALARSASVEVLYPDRPGLTAAPGLADDLGVALSPVVGRSVGPRVVMAATQLAQGRPVAIARSLKPALVQRLRMVASEGAFDAVIADQLVAAIACIAAGIKHAGTRQIYNANNVEWALRRSGQPAERLRWLGTRRAERAVLEFFDESWMVSGADRDAALELAPGARVRVVPNVLDVERVEPVLTPNPEPVALFVGSFDYAPNRGGLKWLVERVMPLVWERRPDARLEVVGRWLGDPWQPADRRVSVRGYVSEIAEAYASARCCVAPLLVGGGTPLKVIEALAYGLPLVATTRAVRAIEGLEPERHAYVADAPSAFADALIRVMDPAYDPGERGTAGRTLVNDRYSVDAIADAVSAALSA